VYSAARRDATHYPHRAHFPKFGRRLGAHFDHPGKVSGTGKLMFSGRFSTPSCLTRKSLDITNAA
jgi:hypothetical protein